MEKCGSRRKGVGPAVGRAAGDCFTKQGGQGGRGSGYRRTIEKRNGTTENQARDARRTDKEAGRVRRISRKIDKGKQGQCYADRGKQYSRRAVKARGMIAKAQRGGSVQGGWSAKTMH